MNFNIQERFRKASHQLLSGDYTNGFSRWYQTAHNFKHQHDLLLDLIEEVILERAEQPLEVDLALQREYEAYFDILKAWIIFDNHDVAKSYFNQLTEEANRNDSFNEPITAIQSDAMNNRAYMHQNGQGGPVNFVAAIALYNRAIALGDTSAMNNRAFMHCLGQGGPVRFVAAITLYDRAIAAGDATAMINRAVMHRNGQGNNEADVRVLINLMWDDLLENKPLTPETQELLSKYPHLITEKLMTIDDLGLLKKLIKEDQVVHRILSTPVTDQRCFIVRIFSQPLSELHKVQKHIALIENRRLVVLLAVEHLGTYDDGDIELEMLRVA